MKKILLCFLMLLVILSSTITNASEELLLSSEAEDVLLPSDVVDMDLLKTWVGEESNNEVLATGSIDKSEKTIVSNSINNNSLPKYLPKTWVE